MSAARALELEAPRPRPRVAPTVGGPESGVREQLGVASLLRMQSAAGNAAVCARLRAEATTPSAPAADKKSTAGEVEEGGMALVDARASQPAPAPTSGGEVQRSPTTWLKKTFGKKKPAVSAPQGGRSMVAVTVPTHVRGTSSPAGMADRIPPRVNTLAHVDIKNFQAGNTPVDVSVEGSGGGNGTVTVDGGATKSMTAAGDVNLQGVAQTDVGKAGSLRLVAKRAGTEVASSAGFSVSAIPQNYSDTFVSLVTGPKRGFVVQDGWESDSGVFDDLDQTEIAEQVEATSATGCFSGVSKNNSGYLEGNKLSQDTHGTPASICTKPGNRVATQTCMFKDKRAGSSDIPMTNSGYTLVRDVRSKGAGLGFEIQTTKNGAAVTANGVASGAGAGSIDKTQDV